MGFEQGFAHAHHALTVYGTMPMAVPSQDGRRVLFASEWAGSGGPTYTYVAGMAP